MTNITTQRIIDRFQLRARDYARSGISWGTDAYPANSITSWFGGDIAGPTALPTSANLGEIEDGKYTVENKDPVALTVKNSLQSFTEQYSQVQRVRILIYQTRSGYSNNASNVLHDAYAVANLASTYRNGNAISAGALLAGNEISWASADDFITRCRSRIWSQKYYTQRTLSNSVCHDSCHMSCHSNRGRR